ncbi:YbaK/EbsC family protein [Marispirochaeta sp.]|jgi:Ala-tRNA(Pro) deacylase|uniref:aminoacyl-tRNA deacylase n=1 Tax=Marispirochaeta sp. TaxID=2038653 RepID=UPI0029C6F300|nr:YbaK/EbsC family protein [Marispirochaeta sp.]
MASEKLIGFLQQNHVHFETAHHFENYTAQETAASAHVKGREFAKSVVVMLDGEPVMAVLPADCKVDLKRLKQLTGAKQASIAHEEEFSYMFPDCSVGAMPPFGNLYHVPVIADSDLMKDETITFNAGNHTEAIRMAAADYSRLVHPRIANIHRRRFSSFLR